MAQISLRNIKKTYPGDVTVVHDFNLEIHDREFIIFVGPSGCGKSTTLRMIAGLEDITGGELYIDGQLMNDVAPKDRDIAMVFQNYALYPHMTVYKNIAFSLQLRKLPKDVIDQKVKEVAEILDITYLLNRKPKALSGGQRQRVALGRGMVREPAAFLLDEPLSNLDAKLRTTMRSEIIKQHRRLKENGTTFVYVTHDQTEAMTMGDRIVVMKDGDILQVDTPQDLYDHPNNLFVAGFIGSPPMNFFEAVVEQKDGQYVARFGSIPIVIPKGKLSEETLAEYLQNQKPIVVGVRPENLKIEEVHRAIENNTLVEVKVDIAELLGSEVSLYGSIGDIKIIAKIPPRQTFAENTMVTLAIEGHSLHFFDKESEQRLS